MNLQPLAFLASTGMILLILAGSSACRKAGDDGEAGAGEPAAEVLCRVGTIAIHESDLRHQLAEHHGGRDDDTTRQKALANLIERARFAQAALDAGLADDPLVRSETGRLLQSRFRETELGPQIAQTMDIPEEDLRALYATNIDRFQVPEKRQAAVLWLDAGVDPDRARRYAEKMGQARAFALQDRDLLDHPEKGFSVLGADYSEHHASRFRGGVVGWLQREGGPDPWTKAVAAIAFSLDGKGAISEVITRKEGVFLVRLMDIRPAVQRSFESVKAGLERDEKRRRREQIESEFSDKIKQRYPVQWEATARPDGPVE